jgi:hypothetical protein
MRGIWRFIAGLVLVLALVAGAGWLARAPLAAAGIRWALASAGVENPALSVEEISLSRLALKDLAAGVDTQHPDIAIKSIDATFDWLTLLRARRLEKVVVGDGALTLRIAPDGTASLAGMVLKKTGGGGGGGGFLFDSLTIEQLALLVLAPEGAASGRISGGFEPETGGAISIAAETALIAANNFRAENARFEGVVDLEADGAAQITGEVVGDFVSPQLTARRVSLSLDGEAGSWREALAGSGGPPMGRAMIDLASADFAVAESPSLGWLQLWRAPEEAAIATLSLAGALQMNLADGRLTVTSAGEEPLRARTDRGDFLAFTPVEGAPFYAATAETERLAAAAKLSGGHAGDGALVAERGAGEDWRFDASLAFEREEFPAVAFGASRISAVGSLAGGVIDADAVVSTLIESAKIGRLNISDTAIASTLRIRTDLNAKELEASNHEAACVDIKRTRVTFEGQDSEMRLTDAEFCRSDGPLIVARWGEEPGGDFAGVLTARDSRLRFVRTRFAGAPPEVDFNATYLARRQLTEIAGSFAGGRVTLNDVLIGSDVDGRFTFTLDRDAMSGEAALDRVRVVQNRKLLFVAPLLAAGAARLADQSIAFEYTASTLRGAPLGAGEGEHDIRTGRGATDFHSGDLVFEPGGLQPASLALALIGIVKDAQGAASGEVRAEWGPRPEDFKTSGNFALDDVSFIGPGRAISKTGGVSGRLELTNLFPLKSAGPQSLEIKLVDLDSLIMENGAVNFELPGDDTLHIINAEFPWYGGRIGAYDTVAAMTGETVTTSLRAENVDLGALLDLAKVDGLSGEGRLSGMLPVVFEEGRARVVDGRLKSAGPGAIRYVGEASDSAASAGAGAQVAFSILRDLRFSELDVTINGYLDGRINFVSSFVGTGEVAYNKAKGQLPVRYRITLDAALLELLKLAQTTQDVRLQIEEGRLPPEETVSETPPPSQ